MSSSTPPTANDPEVQEGQAVAAHGGVVGIAPSEDLEEASADSALVAAPDVLASSLTDYLRGWSRRVRSGDAGILPVIGGLIAIVIFFQIENSLYLSAGNLVNLFNQAVVFIIFAIGEVFVLLLGEIDLSMAYNAGIGAALTAIFVVGPYSWPWWLAILLGIVVTTFLGLVQGLLITRLGLPSFIVTLAGYIGLFGVLDWLFDLFPSANSGSIGVSNTTILAFVGSSMGAGASWVVMAVAVVVFGAYTIVREMRRATSGLVTPPLGLTIAKVGAVAVAGVVLVVICNINRGVHGGFIIKGVPWSIPIVLVIFGLTSLLLARTRFGRYVYAIGGNAEAARRAGINVKLVRTVTFGLAGVMAGLAGIMYLSQIGSISTDIDPTYVLFAVAAAVIGGTSLFGGRGKPLHAVLGGLVIAAVYNGIDLIGLQTDVQYMATAVVLIIAVTVDSLARGVRNIR